MKKLLPLIAFILILTSCTTNKQIQYLQNIDSSQASKVYATEYKLQPNDILKIDVYSSDMQAALPYNKPGAFNNRVANATLQSLQLEGYLIDKQYLFKFPVIGEISVKDKSLRKLEEHLTNLLSNQGHLIDPIVSVRILNSRFTIIGEVRNPGTFTYVDDQLSILQAIGHAGDLTINAKRNEINLIREKDNQRFVYKIDLTSPKILYQTYFNIKPN